MPSVFALATSGVVVALKASFVMAVGVAALVLLDRERAALRAAVAALALGGALIVPALRLSLPSLRAPWIAGSVPVVDGSPSGKLASVTSRVFTSRSSNMLPASAMPAMREDRVHSGVAMGAIVFWLLGSVVVLARVIAGWWSTRELLRQAQSAGDSWIRTARAIRSVMGIPREVSLLQHDAIAIPITAGAVTPVIVLPTTADAWTEERRRLVIAHELAHVQRRDCFVDYLAWLACSAYWWNPLAWRLAARLRVERERSCDDLVLSLGTSAADYADHLVDLAIGARSARARWHAAALALAPVGTLESRVRDILHAHHRRGAMTRATRAVVFGAATLVVVPISALTSSSASRAGFMTGPRDTLDFALAPGAPVSWRGDARPGSTLSLRANMGDIRVDSVGGDQIEIVAERRVGPYAMPADTRLSIIRGGGDLMICSTYSDPARGRSE